MRKIICSLFIALAFFCTPQFSLAQLPMGGQILSIIPCNTGTWTIIRPPLPTLPFSLMYIAGASQFFLNGPPVHPGQYLLGMVTAPMVCFIGPAPVGVGMIILFNGSSL
jgi:hypothetical protein